MRNSFFMAGFAAILVVCLASVLAYAMRLHPTRLTHWAVRTASLGYAIPGPVLAIGILLPFAGIDRALNAWAKASFGITFGLILSGTLVAITFAYLVRFLTVSLNVVEASLGKVTRSMDFAARSLGRTPLGTLTEVHLPIMRGSLLPEDFNRTMGLLTGKSSYQRAAEKILQKETNLEIVVFGHTHNPVDGIFVPLSDELAGKYFNSGSWTSSVDLDDPRNQGKSFDELCDFGIRKTTLDYIEVTVAPDGGVQAALGRAD